MANPKCLNRVYDVANMGRTSPREHSKIWRRLRRKQGTTIRDMTLDLTDDEAAALVKHLRQAIEYDRYRARPGSIRSKRSLPSWNRLRRSRNRCHCCR